MDKKKKIMSILISLIIILTMIGATFAYWSWSSSEEQKTEVTFTKSAGFSCSADGGGNVTAENVSLVPTTVSDSTTNNYIKRTVTVSPTITETEITIYMDLWLDINSIGTGLSNSDNFMYAFTTSSTSPTTGVVSSGNFKGLTTGNTVNLLLGNIYTETTNETYYLWIWLDIAETNAETANQTISLSLNGSCTNHPTITANTLINNANPSTLMYADATDSQKAEMWAFSQSATEQTEETIDYRYIGSSPSNYIMYNNEVWRIIGVFGGRIKIIKDEYIGSSYWDYKQSGVGTSTSSTGSRDWGDSQLMYMLNPTSYSLLDGYTKDEAYIYDESGNVIYRLGCKPASITSGATSYNCTTNDWTLNSTALSQISETTYYLGDSSTLAGQNAKTYYTFERGISVYKKKSINWTGLVGLMYTSDYAYTFANGVDDKCYSDTINCKSNSGGTPNSSWLYKSSIEGTFSTYFDGLIYGIFYVDSAGNVSSHEANYSRGVRPVVYLKSNVNLEGTGTSSDPYEIIG